MIRYCIVMLFLVLFGLGCNSEAKNSLDHKLTSYTLKFDLYFHKYTKQYFGVGFDYAWFKAQAIAESNLDPDAESYVGAKGLMQLMPTTFKEISGKVDVSENIIDPKTNIHCGIWYDKTLWNEWTAERPFEDRMSFVFASYNAGLGNILKAQSVCSENTLECNLWKNVLKYGNLVDSWRETETINYVDRIFKVKE